MHQGSANQLVTEIEKITALPKNQKMILAPAQLLFLGSIVLNSFMVLRSGGATQRLQSRASRFLSARHSVFYLTIVRSDL
jgi:hypothetical protein